MILVIKILENSLHMSVIGAIETTKWRFLHLYFHKFTNVVQISVINPQIAKNYIILRRSAYLKMAYRLRTYISCFLEYVTIDIESFWTECYAGQSPNSGHDLTIYESPMTIVKLGWHNLISSQVFLLFS